MYVVRIEAVNTSPCIGVTGDVDRMAVEGSLENLITDAMYRS